MKRISTVMALAIGAAAISGASARASLLNLGIPATETTLLSDDFANNNAGWANYSGTTGVANYGGTQNGETVLQPDATNGNTTLRISKNLASPLNIYAGPTSIWYRVQVQDKPGSGVNVFFVGLNGNGNGVTSSPNNGYFNFQINPGSNSNTQFQTRGGNSATTGVGTNVTTGKYVNYHLLLTNDTTDTTYNAADTFTLQFFVDTGTGYGTTPVATWSHVPVTSLVGTAATGQSSSLGYFNAVNVLQRANNDADYFDAIAITQSVPEPASLSLMALAGLGLLYRSRKRA